MRQSSEFYLNIAKKQQNLLEQFKRTSSNKDIGIKSKRCHKVEMSLPSLDTKPDEDNPYQNLFQSKI